MFLLLLYQICCKKSSFVVHFLSLKPKSERSVDALDPTAVYGSQKYVSILIDTSYGCASFCKDIVGSIKKSYTRRNEGLLTTNNK